MHEEVHNIISSGAGVTENCETRLVLNPDLEEIQMVSTVESFFSTTDHIIVKIFLKLSPLDLFLLSLSVALMVHMATTLGLFYVLCLHFKFLYVII